jgi:hypothetical protein
MAIVSFRVNDHLRIRLVVCLAWSLCQKRLSKVQHSSIADVSYFENIVSNTWEQQGIKGEKA